MSYHPFPTKGGYFLVRKSFDVSSSSFDSTPEDPESPFFFAPELQVSSVGQLQSFLSTRWLKVYFSNLSRSQRTKCRENKRGFCQLPRPRRLSLLLRNLLRNLLLIAIFLATLVAIICPSYSNPPIRYRELRLRAENTSEAGRANPGKEKVFVAASIFDPNGDLALGAWGQSIFDLIDLLGPSNVFLSIYENGAGAVAQAALKEFKNKTTCEHSIVFQEQLSLLDAVPYSQLPDGSKRVKRIAYLAEIRNRALRPLDSFSYKFDKLLYVNDVMFDPIDAVQLLFATNAGSGKANYRAACAMDFINPFKFYDTFATRDFEGYATGLPIYPWFSGAGQAQSRQDVFDQTDAVRVRSCWGGMVAFDARFFQATAAELGDLNISGSINGGNFTGFQFRAEPDLFWESAECCLIQADIQSTEIDNRGIYMNPYVRVAYDTTTLSSLGWSRRIERLFTPFQYMINTIVGMPVYNPRRSHRAWQEVQEEVWSPNATDPAGGSFKIKDKIASHSGFCGTRALQVLKENRQPGEKNWEFYPVPDG